MKTAEKIAAYIGALLGSVVASLILATPGIVGLLYTHAPTWAILMFIFLVHALVTFRD